MNDDVKKLKSEFDAFLSPSPTFTSKDKHNIRKRIAGKMKPRSTHVLPSFLTGIVLCFIVVFGYFVLAGHQQPQLVALPTQKESALQLRSDLTKTPLGETHYTSIELSASLQSIYEKFANTQNEELLRGLRPFEIFQLFFYAERIEDYETQYALYITDSSHDKVFETVEDYIKTKKTEEGTLLQRIEQELNEGGYLIESIGQNANIIISKKEGLGFGLVKSERDIWKVRWLPIQ
ncbi:hypothetical protein [Bacillus alkalicellulosilyticus]|uniref:hypothetical protein n=1 Tax=Alkalihalobacterium alkalicellulosilyticum TaxID=1912214 RepID=UPI000998ABF4|nr:hypothetical protein [Bacillus alkalicellulosilyticus]